MISSCRDVKLNCLWEQMLGMAMAQHGWLIGVEVFYRILTQQFVLLDFFQKKGMVSMWQGKEFLPTCKISIVWFGTTAIINNFGGYVFEGINKIFIIWIKSEISVVCWLLKRINWRFKN